MPELPEVETVARSLRPHIVGRVVGGVWTSGLALRRPVDERRLRAASEGARIEAIERVAKYLLVRMSRGDVLLCHLGMSGRLLVNAPGDPRAPHTHVVLGLDGDRRGGARPLELRYVDARRFGVVAVYGPGEVERAEEIASLGPDPLGDAFTPAVLAEAARGSKRAIKDFLLDQARVAGLGNIYAAEALFVAGISPRRRAGQLGPARVARLHAAVREVLVRGVDNRGTSLRDYVDADGEFGGNQHHLAVYGREGEPCRACGARVQRLVQGARSTFFCPACQR